MSPQEKLFYSGVCPSLRASTPKREREAGVPDPKKARLAMAIGLDAESDPWGPASQKGSSKGKGKGKSGKGGKGKMSRGSWAWGTEWDQADWNHSWNQSRYGSMEDLVTRMSQLMIKHEFAINSLKQDTTVYFFVKPGAQGLLPILFSTSERWHQVQRDTPEKTEESLRLVLLKALLLELGQRLRNFLESEESQKAARDLGWITESGQWKALIWNPQTEALEEQPGGRTWETRALIAETVELRKLVNQETVFRFQSLKGLTKAPKTAWVQLALELSVRGQGIRAWDLVQSWIGCAAFHTLGCRLRRERGGLSNQARFLRW